MSREVADLRLQLEEASLRSDAYLEAGYPDEAAEVVDEQRRLLSRFQARLGQTLSEAAVEAEAERVLAAAPGADVLSDCPRPAEPEPSVRVSPALLSGLVAVLLALTAIGAPTSGTVLSSTETAPPSAEQDTVAAPHDSRPGAASRAAADAMAPVGPPAASVSEKSDDTPEGPDPSPTDRLAGLLGGLVDAADAAVRDVVRALLEDGHEPPAAPTTKPSVTDAGEAEVPDDRLAPRVSESETTEMDVGRVPVDEGEESTEDG